LDFFIHDFFTFTAPTSAFTYSGSSRGGPGLGASRGRKASLIGILK
jgi:hypothetical protein